MNLQSIQKLIKKHVPEENIWRTNIVGDNDYFNVEIVERSTTVKKGYVHCTTSIGHRRYGEWTKFNIRIYNGTTKTDVLYRIQDFVEYYNKCKGKSESYGKGLQEYIKATGGHRGNPVWMD